jgi:hypothetical protein
MRGGPFMRAQRSPIFEGYIVLTALFLSSPVSKNEKRKETRLTEV